MNPSRSLFLLSVMAVPTLVSCAAPEVPWQLDAARAADVETQSPQVVPESSRIARQGSVLSDLDDEPDIPHQGHNPNSDRSDHHHHHRSHP